MSAPVAAPPRERASDQVTLAALAVVLAGDSDPDETMALALPLLARLGILPPAGLRALALTLPHDLPSPEPGEPPGPALAYTRLAEPVMRAAYLVNASRRLQKGDQSAAEERAHLARHIAASRARQAAATAIDRATRRHGEVLGWYSVRDERTTPECRAAHGSNFLAAVPPKVGYPGTLHGGTCRCKPGPPHREALSVDEAIERFSGRHDIAFTSAHDPTLLVDG